MLSVSCSHANWILKEIYLNHGPDHGNSDHVPAVKALLAGVITRTNASLPAFYIHLGGTAIIADMRTLGELTEKIWSDMDDLDTIWSLPLNTVHRSTESLIQDAWTRHGTSLKTAVICPPHIHGKGMGPGNASSFYVPVFYKEAIKAGAAFFINSGSNVYCRTHIQNVAQVFLKLVESAAAGGESAHWNRNVSIVSFIQLSIPHVISSIWI